MHDLGVWIWAIVVLGGFVAQTLAKVRKSAAGQADDAVPQPQPAQQPHPQPQAVRVRTALAARLAQAAASASPPVPPLIAVPPPAAAAMPVRTGLLVGPSPAELDRDFAMIRPVLPLGLGEPDGARRAVVLLEILGPPVALR